MALKSIWKQDVARCKLTRLFSPIFYANKQTGTATASQKTDVHSNAGLCATRLSLSPSLPFSFTSLYSILDQTNPLPRLLYLSLSNPECRCRTPPPSRSQTEPGCQSELCICTYMKIYIYLIVLIIPRKRVKLGLVHTPH